jgi:putative colanic acid biosynthesis UDP-glucose lipid carrier transferase
VPPNAAKGDERAPPGNRPRHPAAKSVGLFDERGYRRTFYTAPQSVTSLVAAFLEPTLSVLAYVTIALARGQTMHRADLLLCLLVFILTFPGRNRFRENRLAAAVDIASSWAILLSVLLLCGYATSSLQFFDHNVLVLWATVTPFLQAASVYVGQEMIRFRLARPEARRSAVIVGAGPVGVKVGQALTGGHDAGVDVLGYFDDRTDDRLPAEGLAQRLGGLSDVAKYVSDHGVREVYITLPLGSQPRIVELLESAQGTTASIYFVPDVFGISIIQGRLQDVNGVPVVSILETPFTGTNALVKRVSDIVIASLILVLIAPLLLAIAMGVKLSSPGPVIFRQRRNGLDGEEIIVYKFRSMTTQDDGPIVKQATKNDPRITPFGAFLRRTSMDELPQFINVLQGQMSIVGPRPHAVAHNDMYRELIKAYMVRHKVKPGITGWAQVNGFRGETETVEKMRERVEYDLEYLRNWSLALDLQIIARTARLVLFDRNAH